MLPFAPVISGFAAFALGLVVGRFAFRKSTFSGDLCWTPKLSPAEEAERAARYQRWLRQCYTWHNPPTDVTLEDRANLGTGSGLWLCRGGEALRGHRENIDGTTVSHRSSEADGISVHAWFSRFLRVLRVSVVKYS
jgi:hypothetical protein